MSLNEDANDHYITSLLEQSPAIQLHTIDIKTTHGLAVATASDTVSIHPPSCASKLFQAVYVVPNPIMPCQRQRSWAIFDIHSSERHGMRFIQTLYARAEVVIRDYHLLQSMIAPASHEGLILSKLAVARLGNGAAQPSPTSTDLTVHGVSSCAGSSALVLCRSPRLQTRPTVAK
jgi:hypothetical protein